MLQKNPSESALGKQYNRMYSILLSNFFQIVTNIIAVKVFIQIIKQM